MGLLAPWFLAGAVAVGLPLWLHRLRRQNPVRMPFSSLMFFRKHTETKVRERRLRYLALLALRLALLLLLVLAFAKPVWERPPAALGASRPKLALVALDTSLSMQYGDRWSRALAEAEQVVGALARGDRAQLLANGPSVSVLTEATRDQGVLRRALRGLEPSWAANGYGDLVEAVRNLVPDDGATVELHLISDLQNTAMPARFQDLVLPPGAVLELHDVGADDSANWAVESVRGAADLHSGDRPRLEATVASYAEEAAEKTLSLWIDGRPVGSERIELPPGGRVTAGFEIADPPRGYSRAELRLEPPDALPADDMRRATLDNSEPEPLLFVTSDTRGRDLLYFRAALEAGAGRRFSLESASLAEAERVDPTRYALIVLSDLPRLAGRFEARLRTWVEAGGGLLVALGPNSALVRRAAFTGHVVRQPLAAERGRALFQEAGQADRLHAVAAAAGGFRRVKFYLYVRVEPESGDAVPLRFGNGDPLLVEHAVGRGRVLLFVSSLDNVWNDLPLSPVFVPFVAAVAEHLTGANSAKQDALLGDIIELGRRRGSGAAVQVIDPDGERILTLSEAVEREAVALEAVGFYEVRSGGRDELIAVNPAPRESNLRRVEADTLDLWQSTGGAEAARAVAEGAAPPAPPPLQVWRLVLVLLLLSVLLESGVANRHLNALRGD